MSHFALLCARCNAEGTLLVDLGTGVLVCPRCAAGDDTSDDDLRWATAGNALQQLPDLARFEVSGPVVAEALAHRQDADWVRWVAHHAARIWRSDLAASAIEGLGDQVDATDVIDAAYHRFCQGESRHGLRLLASLEAGDLDASARIYWLLNRAALTLDDSAGAPAIAAAAADMDEVRRLLFWSRYRIRRTTLRALRGTVELGLGRVAIARGQWSTAVGHLRVAVDKHGDTRPFVITLLGDALAGAGAIEDARAAWRRAEAEAHPESFHAAQARSRLAAPYR